MHFLLTGDARVTIRALDGKAVMFRELTAGGMFGEHAAIDGRPRSATVEARTDCLVASIPAVAFREMLETELRVAKKLLEHFVSGIREFRVFEFSTLAVRYRIQAEVLRLAGARRRPRARQRASIPRPRMLKSPAARVPTGKLSPANSTGSLKWAFSSNGAGCCGSRIWRGWRPSFETQAANSNAPAVTLRLS